jgi:deazaflavin-dependent oxidoreductase (nitroreductase family)
MTPGQRRSAAFLPTTNELVLNRPGPVLRFVFRLPVFLFRWKLGWVLGHRFLLIVHAGRRTGALHETVVEVLHYDASSGETVVMSGWGSRSDWFLNVEAAGTAEVIVGRRRFPVTHRVLDIEQASRILADYERRNRWVFPVVRKVLGALVGWNYDGSEESRRSLVRQLPLVAFDPEVE